VYAAGLAVGYFEDLNDLRANWAVDHTWNPIMEEGKREQMYRMWKRAVTKSFDWMDQMQGKVVAGVENRKQKLERTPGQHDGKFDE
jgi:hypothetical protein